MKKHFLSLSFFLAFALTMASCHKTEESPLETSRFSSHTAIALTDGAPDSLFIDYSIEFPTAGADSVLPVVQRDMLTKLFGEAFEDMTIDVAMQAYAAMIRTEYKENNLPLYEEMLAHDPSAAEEEVSMLSEAHNIEAEVLGVHMGVLSYCIHRYTYLGGAHGSDTHFFYNYSLLDGHELHQDDLFVEGFEEPMIDMIISAIIQGNDELKNKRDMRRYGYQLRDIIPNDNIYLTDTGVAMLFNAYDIAPYAVGETLVEFTWAELDSLLQPWVKEALRAEQE